MVNLNDVSAVSSCYTIDVVAHFYNFHNSASAPTCKCRTSVYEFQFGTFTSSANGGNAGCECHIGGSRNLIKPTGIEMTNNAFQSVISLLTSVVWSVDSLNKYKKRRKCKIRL